ncbi:ribosome biogenesis protein BMS1 homolog [Harmonia axyridis]|uniref:ribosome biogenesis protein BMS1 homolog n=1 Tax=Harmonia axyridis TaxID=115357 RepID=UPI001E277E7D|nr:ribosome biogenesis protein BMS1 homolog [Harmonia axyridis]
MEKESVDCDSKKSHRDRRAGRKADKKKAKDKNVTQILTDKQRNPKAFGFNSAIKAERQFRRKQDVDTKKQHIPLVDRTPIEPPPIIISVVGPPKVGKTTLIKNLIKLWTKTPMTNIKGPVSIVIGKKRRVTLIECNNDINCMIDLAKVTDLVLLLCDANFGFEMEVFEFLNICQVHGMPRIMGVLNHLDMIKNSKKLKTTKKTIKNRFWKELYPGAKLFYLSGIIREDYLKNEIKNLGRFISLMKFRPLSWRSDHSYILVDRYEDLTNQELLRNNPKCDRNISLYGYIRGMPLKQSEVHIAGLGDLSIHDISFLPDPCPLPEELKKRALIEKEKMIYAPFSGVGGIVYDKDAVYVELGGSHSHKERRNDDEVDNIVNNLIEAKETLDTKMEHSEMQIFTGGENITAKEINEFSDSEDCISEEENDEEDDENEAEDKIDFVEEQDGEKSSKNKNSKDDEDEFNEELSMLRKKSHTVEKIFDSGRVRRKVIFETMDESFADTDDESSADTDDESYNESSDEGNQISQNIKKKEDLINKSDGNIHNKIKDVLKSLDDKKNISEVSEDETKENIEDESDLEMDESEESDEDEPSEGIKWKDNLAKKAQDAFMERQMSTRNLRKLCYGEEQLQETISEEQENELGNLLKTVSKSQQQIKINKGSLDAFENTEKPRYIFDLPIKNCFVTGTWKESEDANELLKIDAAKDLSDSESEVFGDFEDLETGEKRKREEPENTDLEYSIKKKALKERFDDEYDNGENNTFYDELKLTADKQSQLNKTFFENMPDDQRTQIQGFRSGMYVRMEFKNVPSEFITNFDPTYPIIVGSLNTIENKIGYVNVKLKKHRWYSKILKTADPLIISLGWRRFQTLPLYSKMEDDMKFRYLKYTPKHVSCNAHFWGPLTPPQNGFLAVQSVESNPEILKNQGFRIAATGTVGELVESTQILKKLKLIGYPDPTKIFKKTAFIKDMFNSSLEVAKFEGAKIKTVSGIRGQIKKPINKPEGTFRATFEDQIKASDIVFCRTWKKVDVPQFYNPVTNLLLPIDQKNTWKGARTTGEIKRENNIKAQVNPDHLYEPIIREEKPFAPLVIPKKLQAALPYRDKPKHGIRMSEKKKGTGRVAVIMEPKEQKVMNMMKMIKTVYNKDKEKEKQKTKERLEKYRQSNIEAQEEAKNRNIKKIKKEVMRNRSKRELSKKK